jgi:solute carrier family 31 (copper transporter), member 1
MLWNWYTVDTCFLSSSWHVTSSGMFAGSCIGVICLVISLEFLRRLGKEYDQIIVRNVQKRHPLLRPINDSSSESRTDTAVEAQGFVGKDASNVTCHRILSGPSRTGLSFRPSILQQTIRAFLHMLQFAVAYFIMLLAMYYNG